VMRRPALFITGVLVVVLVLASPARNFYPGVVGAESLPPGDPTFAADRLLREQLGGEQHEPILVVAKGVGDAAQAADLETAIRAAARESAVFGYPEAVALVNGDPAAPRSRYLNDGYAVYEVQQRANDNDRETRALIDRLRAMQHPPGVSILLTGESPAYYDFLNVLLQDFPKIFAVVLGLTFLLLLFSFRSVVLPVKAVVMNLL